ncbi:hypothetical protein [Vibrio sp. R78045]|uniref:hypothetical protein n=1 Tax=Vibrio sp. R78045 TaxID=3093868 RepID=UPI0036F2F470
MKNKQHTIKLIISLFCLALVAPVAIVYFDLVDENHFLSRMLGFNQETPQSFIQIEERDSINSVSRSYKDVVSKKLYQAVIYDTNGVSIPVMECPEKTLPRITVEAHPTIKERYSDYDVDEIYTYIIAQAINATTYKVTVIPKENLDMLKVGFPVAIDTYCVMPEYT